MFFSPYLEFFFDSNEEHFCLVLATSKSHWSGDFSMPMRVMLVQPDPLLIPIQIVDNMCVLQYYVWA